MIYSKFAGLCLATVLSVSPLALAQGEENSQALPSEEVILDRLAESEAFGELEGLTAVDETMDAQEEGSDALDGIDDEMEAGRWHRGHGRRWHGPRWHAPHRRWAPYPRRPFYPVPVPVYGTACFARNGAGVVFRARGYGSPRRLQREAMWDCRQNSWNPGSCHALGCR